MTVNVFLCADEIHILILKWIDFCGLGTVRVPYGISPEIESKYLDYSPFIQFFSPLTSNVILGCCSFLVFLIFLFNWSTVVLMFSFYLFFIISYKSLRIFLLCNCVATILLLLSFYMFLSFSFIVILFLLASHVSFISGSFFIFTLTDND